MTLPRRKRTPSHHFDRIVTELQAWRDEDHGDAKVLHRNQIIEILEGIYALRSQHRPVMWQQIETAPKDGTRIVIWNKIYDHCPIAKWAERDADEGFIFGWELEGSRSPCGSCEDDFIGWNEDQEDGFMPTHWTDVPDSR